MIENLLAAKGAPPSAEVKALREENLRLRGWLFDVVSGAAGLAPSLDEAAVIVARECQLLPEKAQEIVQAVLAPEAIAKLVDDQLRAERKGR
jgi:hypothetical protein